MLPTRRDLLQHAGGGFGGLALAHLLATDTAALPHLNGGLHHRAKVRRVIQLFMNGGASPMDTFDYKPGLEKLHGQKLGPTERPEGFTGDPGAIMKTPFKFRQHGQSGRWVSEVFPEQAKVVDELAFLMAMASKTNVHGPAAYLATTGFLLPGYPCFGAWVSYALGRLTDNLPAFVVLPDAKGLPYNQKGTFSAGFLPAVHQATVIDAGAKETLPHLFPPAGHPFATRDADREGLELLGAMNREHAVARPGDSRLEARIAGYATAAKMQAAAPEAFDLTREPVSRHKLYGTDDPVTADFGRRCLLAARLVERGVRFVQVWSGPQGATGNWDNHANIRTELPAIARTVDKPLAALVTDLKTRGLLADTLVIWTTEFGRTPFAQGSLGRDHNGGSYVSWLCGAGVKAGTAHGRSDDWGYRAEEGKATGYDLHATVLHLMGVDHERLTVRHDGTERRLTDVHGKVIHEVLA